MQDLPAMEKRSMCVAEGRNVEGRSASQLTRVYRVFAF